MERAATRETPSSKRGRKASALSSSRVDTMGSPPHKKPRHHRLSLDTKDPSSESSEDVHNQNKRYAEELVSIRLIVENLRYMEKKFHHEQQKRYEKFHYEQQELYDGLIRRISGIDQWPDRKVRVPKQEMKNSKQSKEEGKDRGNMALRLEMKSFSSDSASAGADVDMALASSSRTSHKDLAFIPKTGHETGSSRGAGKSDLSQLTLQKQLVRDPNPIGKTGKQGRILELTSPPGLTVQRRLNKRAPKSPTLVLCDDLSDGDDEDGGLVEGFQMAGSPRTEVSRSSGVLNEDGAIEGVEIGSGFIELEMGDQRHGPLPLPVGKDQCQSHLAGPNATPTLNRVRYTSPQSTRSLRKIKRVNYELPPPFENEEENSLPPTEAASRTPSKTPARLKPQKNPQRDDRIRYQTPTKETTGTPKKKGAVKSTDGQKVRTINDYFPPKSASKPVGEGDHLSHCLSNNNNNNEPEPIPYALVSAPDLTRGLAYAREPGRLLPDAATKYRAVRSIAS